MPEWKKTSCVLCDHNCGLEFQTEGHSITKFRADKHHPRTKGYICRNGAKLAHYQENKDRLRAIIASGSNLLRSCADTPAYERAFREVELLVSLEVVMSETARMSHYVLPAKSAYEKWDPAFFNITFPEVYFQVCAPVCEPLGELLEEGEIFTRLADAMGIVPEILESLERQSRGDRSRFAMEMLQFMGTDKKAARFLPFVVSKTLGRQLGSAHLSALWGLLMMYPRHVGEDMARAGHELNPLASEGLFRKLLDHPEGIMIAKVNPEANLERVRTADRRIHLHIEEMEGWMGEITPEKEKRALENTQYRLVLAAGRHFPHTANTIMRDPAWNDDKPVCTFLVSGKDSRSLGVKDGEEAWLITETSRVRVPVEVSDIPCGVSVVLPHGFRLSYEGKERGVNVNQLTRSTHREQIAGTPLHRYVPCRVEAA